MAEEVRVLAATGMVGAGYLESTLEKGLARDPDFIDCDAGSTDGGPATRGIKVTIPRPITQGDLEDSDSYGGQLFGPLVDLEVPD